MASTDTTKGVVRGEDVVTRPGARKALALMRIALGFVFFWAFIDKLLGFGFMTSSDKAWIHGGSPSTGFLGHVEGPFSGLFSAFGGMGAFADVLFMAGLLGIGTALILGIGLKVAAVSGTILLFLMYLAEFPLANGGTNPLIDAHILDIIMIITVCLTRAGDTWGLGKWWRGLVGESWLR